MDRTSAPPNYPITPDGRYFIVRGKLWRLADPHLDPAVKADLVKRLMSARRTVRTAKLGGDLAAEMSAHREIDDIKRRLGERGPVWWADGAPDFNRHSIRNTPYADWYAAMKKSKAEEKNTLRAVPVA